MEYLHDDLFGAAPASPETACPAQDPEPAAPTSQPPTPGAETETPPAEPADAFAPQIPRQGEALFARTARQAASAQSWASAPAQPTPRPAFYTDGFDRYGAGSPGGPRYVTGGMYVDPSDSRTSFYGAQPRTTSAPPSAPEPAKPQKPAKKKHTGLWITLGLLFALVLGAAGGAAGYHLLAGPRTYDHNPMLDREPAASLPEETRGAGDITQRVKRAQSGEYKAPAEIYQNNVNAVVGIVSEGTTTNVWGQASSIASSGTGFVISDDGYILTNYHVVKGGDNLTVQLYDGTEYPARVVGYENLTCDVALLKIEAEDLPTVQFGSSDDLMVGEEVCTIGNPLGELTYTLTVGYVSAKERAINTDGSPINMMQIDATINAGNSGGPLFDMAGNVVGIVTAKYSGSTSSGTTVEGLGFALPIGDVMEILDDLQQYGYVTTKPYLGVKVGDSAAVQGQNLPAGAYLSEVVEGYCAHKAGLQAGDVIVGMDDTVISSYEGLVTAMNGHKAGDTVTVTVFRAGKYLTLELTFDARPRELDQPAQEPQTEPEPTESVPQNPFGFTLP